MLVASCELVNHVLNLVIFFNIGNQEAFTKVAEITRVPIVFHLQVRKFCFRILVDIKHSSSSSLNGRTSLVVWCETMGHLSFNDLIVDRYEHLRVGASFLCTVYWGLTLTLSNFEVV